MEELTQVKFLKPGPAYGFSYGAGELGHVASHRLKDLLEKGIVELVEVKKEKATSKKTGKAEKAIKK